jgi:hypothetical protein
MFSIQFFARDRQKITRTDPETCQIEGLFKKKYNDVVTILYFSTLRPQRLGGAEMLKVI